MSQANVYFSFNYLQNKDLENMDIAPFKGFRFDPLVVSDVGSCICPPYDVIDADYQQKLYEKNPQNIVRIIKGKTSDADNDQDNKYTRAAKSLTDWIESGALKEDASEAIYGYVQDFHVAGGTLCLMAAFSAGIPKASQPMGCNTLRPCMRW